ncbi:MAG: methylmalonyl-CoA mutase family protein [Caldilineae bacterium]|nr:methylmalonyl-CoA mutase family protein [Chloroflexota bacterium]MCB9176400.1 methylmalonyl-CoA mutase family protein [Caldilineae bacterium]
MSQTAGPSADPETAVAAPVAPAPYVARRKVRIVTAASLFDGHDAAINIMRRILQASGAEVIHLGHNRSVRDIVDAAIQEDAQGIAISSYQGGHMEYFRYMVDLLREAGCGQVRVFGGGGGTIIPEEKQALEAYGVARIYHPEDGRNLGLQGMIDDIMRLCDYDPAAGESPPQRRPLGENGHGGNGAAGGIAEQALADPASQAKAVFLGPVAPDAIRMLGAEADQWKVLARAISEAEAAADGAAPAERWAALEAAARIRLAERPMPAPVIGITGTGGAGKSSFTDELLRRYVEDFPEARVAVLSVDPTKKRTGGALLGDRIRMNSLACRRIFMRSLATRGSGSEVSAALDEAILLARAAGYDLIIAETSGIGQADAGIVDLVDRSIYVMTPEFGAQTQLEKIEMIDLADLVVINKYDKPGADDALRDVRKAYQRAHDRWHEPPEAMPVYATMASQFNDRGCNQVYLALIEALRGITGLPLEGRFTASLPAGLPDRSYIIPPRRVRYLADVADTVERYKLRAREQAELAGELWALRKAVAHFTRWPEDPAAALTPFASAEIEAAPDHLGPLMEAFNALRERLDPGSLALLRSWPETRARYAAPENRYTVRGREIVVDNFRQSLSHQAIPKVALPDYPDWGNQLAWLLLENLPGGFPYTAGVFPFKREGEDPTRMFAGEGGPWRTNKRFHYLSRHAEAKRLSTAFDSVTLYGEDPDRRPDIWGKVGNSGVSIATVEDMEALYAGFDLCDPRTSVSMTINGPAPTILAFYMNAAIRQSLRKHLRATGKLAISEADCLQPNAGGLGFRALRAQVDDAEYARIAAETVAKVRGTVQADILKEDQGQNTCIFSTEFSLKLMGDVQQWFIDHGVRNFYSVSISGYHIAEAGANPISQLAFTLANGFTFVEYYLARGMDIDAFAANLSFFFSNGMDPEYAVIGRVARRIWALAMRELYGANDRSQMLKYHIQTSGRSLHAQEVQFNDIRTTLQALLAIYDNCNSLHTNAFDEAITTPTEDSVRRALAIQLIINHEFGMAMNENPNQGAFIVDALTELVEEAVLAEFHRLTDRGGVLGAMERMYQRSKIQEESLYYEQLKHSGELPIIGVNTFLAEGGAHEATTLELIRASEAEKEDQLRRLQDFHARHADEAEAAALRLKQAAIAGDNVFDELMRAVQSLSLGQISRALYEVGGQYRRNM